MAKILTALITCFKIMLKLISLFFIFVELTKVGSKVEDILISLAKMLEEDKQKEKELVVGLILTN